jgi:hypothetical protein
VERWVVANIHSLQGKIYMYLTNYTCVSNGSYIFGLKLRQAHLPTHKNHGIGLDLAKPLGIVVNLIKVPRTLAYSICIT